MVPEGEPLPRTPTAEARDASQYDPLGIRLGSFVLMPSACPYGRKLSALARRNYETMIELATGKAD